MILRAWLPKSFVAMTISPNLLILSRRLELLEPWQRSMVYGHEDVHAQQQRRDGWLRFMARYLFSGEWRARYELEANRVNLAALIGQGALEGTAAESIIAKVSRAYFPRWWFGRAPDLDVMYRMLIP